MIELNIEQTTREKYYLKFGQFPPDLNLTDEQLDWVDKEAEKALNGKRGKISFKEVVESSGAKLGGEIY